jgi:acetyltransferase-like isoleucine patch superfamily enzyme
MKGVTIAERCIVAPGSIVMKSVREPYTMVAGNPAVVVRKLPENMKMHHRTETEIH